jgi:hypothetical protein
MTTVYAIHETEADHLAEVIAEMRALGAPTIRVVDCGDHYMALEGSHRLAAAAELGLTPELVVSEQDDVLDITAYDWYDEANWGETTYTAGEVAGELYSVNAVPYSFA